MTDERFKTTEQASNPDELLSVNAYYEMNAELDDRPEHIKLEMEKRVEAKPASEPTE